MPNPVVHFEIGCRDRARTADFFSKLFDWNMEHEAAADYVHPGDEIGTNYPFLRRAERRSGSVRRRADPPRA